MKQYVDGFLIPLPKNKVEDYIQMARKASEVWMRYGALDYAECVGDDFDAKGCQSFPQGLNLKDDETVVFSWIRYKSREHRDAVNAKVMEDPEIKGMCESGDMPFDPSRMMYSGFQVVVDASSLAAS